MTTSKECLDELLKGVQRPDDLVGDAVLMKQGQARIDGMDDKII